MATHQLGFTGTPNSIFYGTNAYATTGLASGTIVAPASGTCTKMFVWKDDGDEDLSVEVGIYSDDGAGDAEDLLGNGTKSSGWEAGWNEVTISSVSIVNGVTYHPAVVMASGSGEIGYDTTAGNTSERAPGVTALPDPWAVATSQTYCFAVYAEYDSAGGLSIPVAMYYYRSQQ